jgi:hypothetical protein
MKKRGILRLNRTSVYAPDKTLISSGARRAHFERTLHETPPRWRQSEWVEIFIKNNCWSRNDLNILIYTTLSQTLQGIFLFCRKKINICRLSKD